VGALVGLDRGRGRLGVGLDGALERDQRGEGSSISGSIEPL